MKTIPVRIVEPAQETNETCANETPPAQNNEKIVHKYPKTLIVFLLGMLVMGIIATLVYNSHYKKYSKAIQIMEDQLTDQERFQRNNAIIMRAIQDNNLVNDRMLQRSEEMKNAVGEVLKPRKITIK